MRAGSAGRAAERSLTPVYAESSALLAWLLGQSQADRVERLLQEAPLVVTSDLTLVECERGLHRLSADKILSQAQCQDRRDRLARAAMYWTFMTMDKDVVEGAKSVFPVEPVRSLDALHLASALKARRMLPELSMLTLDQRIRENALPLGFALLPE